MREKYQPLAADAESVLKRNDRGTHTVPAGDMYGNASWLWDGAFTAEGIRHYNPRRAAIEIDHVIDAQWQNGMIPHMRIYRGFMDKRVWASRRHPDAPRNISTSGITQPPLMAEAVRQVSEKLDASDRLAFIHKNFGRIASYHEWVYRERNLNGEGLFTSVHPWETGMDNSPSWMKHMETLDWGLSGKVADVLNNVIQRFRSDTKFAPEEQLASKDDSSMLFRSFIKLRHHRYLYERLAEKYPLHVEDVHMTSILIRNNSILEELSEEYKLPLSEELRTQIALSRISLEHLYDDRIGLYYPRDAITKKSIHIPSVASIMPIYANTSPPERIKKLVEHLDNPASFNQSHGAPSVPADSKYYNEHRYWAGPTWSNVDSLLIKGLRRSQHHKTADRLTQANINRVQKSGFYEYASAKSGEGLGANDFSWTAAVVLDLLNNEDD